MITTSLGKYYFLRNPIPLTLTTDQQVATAGVKAVYNLEFSSIPAEGTTLSLQWDGGNSSITITFLAAPGSSDTEFARSGPALEDFRAGLIQDFEANSALSRLFTIGSGPSVSGSVSVILTARAVGQAYNITHTTTVAGFTLTQNVAGVDEELNENLRIFLQVQHRKVGEATWQSRNFLINPDKGNAELWLNRILNEADAASTMPAHLPAAVQSFAGALMELRLRYAEQFDTAGFVSNKLQTYSNNTLILPGGVDFHNFPGLNLQAQFDANNTWLTNYPARIWLHPTQPFFLNYVNASGQSDIQLNCQLFYRDESSSAVLVKDTRFAAGKGIYLCPVAYGQIKDDVDPAKELFYWQYWWSLRTDPATPLSTKITFFLDDRKPHDETLLLYKNSYGVYEVARFTGQVRQVMKNSRKEVDIFNPAPAIQARATRNFHIRYTLYKEVHTGHRGREQMQQLIDVLTSRDVYVIREDYYRPVNLEVSDVDLRATRSGRLNGAVVKLWDTNSEKNYSDGRYSG